MKPITKKILAILAVTIAAIVSALLNGGDISKPINDGVDDIQDLFSNEVIIETGIQ